MLATKRKICVVIVNRANYGRIKTAMAAIQDHPDLELQVIAISSSVLSGYGDVAAIIASDNFPVSARLFTTIEGGTPAAMAKSTGMAMIELTTQFEHLRPDIVLTIADRYETIAVATAATYMNIPLAHTQGGEVTGSIDERVRHAVTKMADLHFPATQKSAENVIRMGENPNAVWTTGCPAIDIVAQMDFSENHFGVAKYGGAGKPVNVYEPFLLVIQHPVTTEFGSGRQQIEETMQALNEIAMPTLMLWPNIDAGTDAISKGIRTFRERNKADWLYLLRNVKPEDYVRLMNLSSVIVGNSSSGIREGAFLGLPCVNIGTRQSDRERGHNVLDVGYDRVEIANAIRHQLKQNSYAPSMRFGRGDAGKQIAEVLATVDIHALYQQKRLHYECVF